ncbi:hypothetical protein F4604DRAFT_1682186 [Suillus subluteus]|nr:hypothetical protein F4604DRAFT_1682186 [Suillus subluteus]
MGQHDVVQANYAELPGTLHKDTFEAKTAKFFNMGVLPQQEWVPLNHQLVGGRCSPDLVFIEKGASGSSIIEWKDLISICKIKYEDSKSLVDDAYLQLGNKANFIFNTQPDCSCLGIDTHTWLQGPSMLVPTIKWDDHVPGTPPFAANEILDEKKDHAAAYDLQSFFWLAYLLCCNCQGAFNNHHNWCAEIAANEKRPQRQKTSAITTSSTSNVDLLSPAVVSSSDGTTASAAVHSSTSISTFPSPSPVLVSSLTVTLPSVPSSVPSLTASSTATTSIAALDPMSVFMLSPSTRMPEHVKIMYFQWVQPGVHEMSAGEIIAERQTMSDQNFINLMMPYFPQHAAVQKGMMELKWMFMGEPYEDKTSRTHQMMVYPPEQITHKIVLQKL